MKGLLNKVLLILFLVLQLSCNRKEKIYNVDTRIIEFNVNYIDRKAGSIPTNILPKRMTLFFAEEYAMNKIEGFLGQFSLTYVADRNKETVVTLLKIFDKKYYYKGKPGELPVGINPMNAMKTSRIDSMKIICGFQCHGWKIELEGQDDIFIFGTQDIKVNSPNITTPYRDHKDVLLEFYTGLSVLDMQLIAENYREEQLSNMIFMIPEDYQMISRAKMKNTIDELFK